MPGTVLINVLTFTGLTVGIPETQPHGLREPARPNVAPDVVMPLRGVFTVTADSVDVTVTRPTADSPDAVTVLVARYHTYLRDFVPGTDPFSSTLVFEPGSSSASSTVFGVFLFGATNVNSGANTRFMNFGFGAAAGTTLRDFAISRPGIIRNIRASHNLANGNGNDVVYTLRQNGAGTALSVSLATGAIGSASNLIDTVSVAAGDLIGLDAIKPAAIGSGILNATVTVEYGIN